MEIKKINQPKKKLNISNDDDLIDPEFLEHIPEELRADVLQNQKKLMSETNVVNQFYNPQDIDPDLLHEINPELVPGITEITNQNNNTNNNPGNPSNQNNDPNNANNNNNNNNQNVNLPNPIDSAAFIYNLPPDIREEILLTSSPSFIQTLPQDLREEAQRLVEIYYPQRLIPINIHPREVNLQTLNNVRFSPPPELNIHNVGSFMNVSIPFAQPFYQKESNVNNKKFAFHPPKYIFEDILSSQKHHKENTSFILNNFDDEFLENLICSNVKFICESSPKSKVTTNQYWILINNLIQNTNLRYKIMDILFILWIFDSLYLSELLHKQPEKLTKFSANYNNIVKLLNELYIENKILEEFFYDDYDQFIKNFCTNFQKEMKKFFLETFYNDKGEYSLSGGKKYPITKNTLALKEILKINYEKEENVLSNLIKIMLINAKSDIKKIFALKIFTNIFTYCLNNNTDTTNKDNILTESKNLKISDKTIEMIVDLFYNFETVLEINKDKRSNNPTILLCEMIADHKCFKLLLRVLLNHIEKLNENVSYEMEHFFSNKKIDINEYSKPLPETILFKIIKLVNQINITINKRTEKEDSTNKEVIPVDNNISNVNPDQNNNNNNQMIVEVTENNNNNNNLNNHSNTQNVKNKKPKDKKSEKIKNELNEFIKTINTQLIKCWEKLDLLLFEVSKMMKEDQKVIDPKLIRLIPYLEAFITLSHLQFLA